MNNKNITITPVRMAELLLTRFTHDIAGPVSAVSNGLDFVMAESANADDPGAIEIRNQAVDLIEESSKQSLARLQAYRTAYGVVYNDSADTQTKEIVDIVDRFFHKSQVIVEFNSELPSVISSIKRRIFISMILTAARSLIYGGKIYCTFEGDDKIIVKTSSEKFKEPSIIKEILDGNSEMEPDVENIPYFFIKDTCEKYNIEISYNYSNKDENKNIEFAAKF